MRLVELSENGRKFGPSLEIGCVRCSGGGGGQHGRLENLSEYLIALERLVEVNGKCERLAPLLLLDEIAQLLLSATNVVTLTDDFNNSTQFKCNYKI